MKRNPTPAGIGTDITGTTSLCSAGLLVGGPWNHPFTDNLTLPGERTSDTYIQKKNIDDEIELSYAVQKTHCRSNRR